MLHDMDKLCEVVCLGIIHFLKVLISYHSRGSKTYLAHLISCVFSLVLGRRQVLCGSKPNSLAFENLGSFGTLDLMDLNL